MRRGLVVGLTVGMSCLSGMAVGLRPAYLGLSTRGADESRRVDQAEPRPDLTVSLKASTPSTPRQDVSLGTTVKNIGAGAAPPSSCDVIIRNARPPRQQLRRYAEAIPALDPGGAFTFTITVKPGFGAYEVCAVADPKNLIVESDETNNQSCETVIGK
jgi:subtilase family serine protease